MVAVVPCAECGADVEIVNNAQKGALTKGHPLCCPAPSPCQKARKARVERERTAARPSLRAVCAVCNLEIPNPSPQILASVSRGHCVSCSDECRRERIRESNRESHSRRALNRGKGIKITCAICNTHITKPSRGQTSAHTKALPVTCGEVCARALHAGNELAKYHAKAAAAEKAQRQLWQEHTPVNSWVPAGSLHPNSILSSPL